MRASLVSASNWMRMNRFTNQDITFPRRSRISARRSRGGLPRPEHRPACSLRKIPPAIARASAPFQWMIGGFYLSPENRTRRSSCRTSPVPPACPRVLAGARGFFGLDFSALAFSPSRRSKARNSVMKSAMRFSPAVGRFGVRRTFIWAGRSHNRSVGSGRRRSGPAVPCRQSRP